MAGHHVAAAGSCDEAMLLALTQTFDLYLLDIELPDGDGCELLRRLLAIHRVPAYRAYLASLPVDPDRLYPAGILQALPETDKHSYIDAYPLAERCVDGRVRFKGVTIDESSGSTGIPYNWIRSAAERRVAHRNIAFFARYAYGEGNLVTLNAFSMGAWATGFNMSLGLNRHGLVK